MNEYIFSSFCRILGLFVLCIYSYYWLAWTTQRNSILLSRVEFLRSPEEPERSSDTVQPGPSSGEEFQGVRNTSSKGNNLSSSNGQGGSGQGTTDELRALADWAIQLARELKRIATSTTEANNPLEMGDRKNQTD